MRVLIAPDCFGGTLTAVEAARAMAAGWGRAAPHDTLELLPLADGGPGFVDALHAARGGDLVPVVAPGPLGEPVPATLLVVPGPAGPTVYLESAQALGLHLVPAERRDPSVTSTRGLGVLLAAALDLAPARIVVGLGGSATNDAGAGLLAALGAGEVLGGGGGGLGAATAADVAALPALRERFAAVDLVAAYDVDVPLLGLHGASAGFAAQKGATPQQAQDLERSLAHFAALVETVLAAGPRRDLLGSPTPPARLPGAGAAGGTGFGLAALGARLAPGAGVVADAVGLAAAVDRADLLVTGEGTLDWQSGHGKVVGAVAEEGMRRGIATVAVAGQVLLGRREQGAVGLSGAYAVATGPEEVAAAFADPATTLADRTERVARTWSPAR